MERQQTKCPSCGSFKTVDLKSNIITGGVMMTLFFLPTLFFIAFIFPIILVLAGIIVIIYGVSIKNNVRMKCNGCGFLFAKV